MINKKRIIIIIIIIIILLVLGFILTKTYDIYKQEKNLFEVSNLVNNKLNVEFNLKNISKKNQDLSNYKVCYLDKGNNLIIYSEVLFNGVITPEETISIIRISNTDISIVDHVEIAFKDNECNYNKDLRDQYNDVQIETGIKEPN